LKQTYIEQKFSYYYHIIIQHLEEKLKEFGTVSQFSNQGTEAIHYLAQIQVTQTNRGGSIGRKKISTNMWIQVFLLNLRRLVISF